MPEKIIEATNLCKEYLNGAVSTTALENASFTVAAGEYISIIGPSGSGKSTLLSIIGGLARPTAGSLKVDGIDVYQLPPERLADYRREYIGFVFQQFQLIPYLTAAENVMLPLVAAGVPSSQQQEISSAVLTKVGLGNKLDRLPSQLSGGEQERVAIARAVANRPPILLADEPTGALDSKTSDEVLELLESLQAEGLTVILITHNPQVASRSKRVIEMLDGKVLAN